MSSEEEKKHYQPSAYKPALEGAIKKAEADAGQHYRFHYRNIKLDPFRIASIYNMQSFAMMTILKKCLCAGNRGHKDYEQDLRDIICAAQRELEMVREDKSGD